MIKIVCVGKLKEKYLLEAINDYEKRILKYHKISIIEVKDCDMSTEEKSIMSNIKKDDYVILLDIYGKQYSSVEFSKKIDNLFINGNTNVTFIIGGSDGVTEEIKKISRDRISFSPMTFPHGIFRLILLEQIYRAFKIINNESYHK